MRDYFFIMLMGTLLVLTMARPFVGVILWSWISFMSVHRLGWGVINNLPWAMLTFGATVVGCLVAREPKSFRPTAIMVLLLIFAAAITFTTLVAISHPDNHWMMWDKVFKIVIGLVVTGALLNERWRIHAMVWLMVIGVGYFGVKGGLFTIMTGGIHNVVGPPDSMIGDRNHLAVALLFVIPLMNWLRLYSAHRIVRIGLIFAMVMTLFGAIGTQSRGALVAMIGVAFLLWLRTRGKIVSGIAIAVAVAGVITFMPESWVERMRTIETYEEDRSAMGRVEIWKASLSIALARPFTGGGFRAMYEQGIVDAYHPEPVTARAAHSIYFEVLGEHGFLVFGLWLAMIGVGVWYTFRLISLARNRPSLAWAGDLGRMAQVSLVAYLVGGAFLSLSYWDVFWTLMVTLGATHAIILSEVREGRAPLAEAKATAGWRAARPARPGWRDRPAGARAPAE